MKTTNILVILSGGQDSTTCLAMMHAAAAKSAVPLQISAVSFDYGQRHARELICAQHVAQLAGIDDRHEIIRLGADILKGTSPLVNASEQLETYDDYQQMDKIIGDRIEKTFVPMRNALFLTVAANRLAVKGGGMLVTGVCEADNANYPDCRLSFIVTQERAINKALGIDDLVHPERVRIEAPLIGISKAESVRKLWDLGMDYYSWLAFSHTAYDGQYPPVGKDHASVLRAQGFLEAGLPDPLVIRAHAAGLMALPATPNYALGPQFDAILDAIMNSAARIGVTY